MPEYKACEEKDSKKMAMLNEAFTWLKDTWYPDLKSLVLTQQLKEQLDQARLCQDKELAQKLSGLLVSHLDSLK